jgi:hypothetical protein
MKRLNTFQINCLIIGTNLAVEIQASSPEHKAFIVIGSYIPKGAGKHSKALNADHSSLRFWLRKYEIESADVESTEDTTDHDLLSSIYLDDIPTIEELEAILGKYLHDFSLMEAAWKVRVPFP